MLGAGHSFANSETPFHASHLEAIRTGAVVGSCGVRDTGAIVLAGRSKAGGALGHQADVCWTWKRRQEKGSK